MLYRETRHNALWFLLQLLNFFMKYGEDNSFIYRQLITPKLQHKPQSFKYSLRSMYLI